jgi:hypothetical protein
VVDENSVMWQVGVVVDVGSQDLSVVRLWRVKARERFACDATYERAPGRELCMVQGIGMLEKLTKMI